MIFCVKNLIVGIWHDKSLVAYHLYNIFTLDSKITPKLKYFSIFDEEYYAFFKNKNAQTLMSLEYLNVLPEWRKSITGVSFADVIVSLGLRIQKQLGIDASIAPAKKQTKVHELCYKLGAECVKKDVYRGNIHCDFIAFFQDQIREPQEAATCNLIEALWNSREDFSGLLVAKKQQNLKIAA